MRIHRILRIDGQLVEARISLDCTGLLVHHDAPTELLPQLRHTLDHWFGLSQDTSTAYKALAALPTFASVAKDFPNLRLISYPDLFEALATTVIGQQISLAAARTLAGRYVESLGQVHHSGLRAFPTAQATADLDPLQLQAIIHCPLSRATTLHTVARWFQDYGRHLTQDPATFLTQLQALRGVGPWTRDYMALRGLRDPQIFLHTDLVVRRALKNLGTSEQEISALPAEAGYLATLQLWAYDAEQRKK